MTPTNFTTNVRGEMTHAKCIWDRRGINVGQTCPTSSESLVYGGALHFFESSARRKTVFATRKVHHFLVIVNAGGRQSLLSGGGYRRRTLHLAPLAGRSLLPKTTLGGHLAWCEA